CHARSASTSYCALCSPPPPPTPATYSLSLHDALPISDVRVHRAFIDQCCQQFMDGTLDVATVSMAKLATTEMQKRVIDSCLQLRSEEHTSELQSRFDLVCRLLLEKKKKGLMSRSDACA